MICGKAYDEHDTPEGSHRIYCGLILDHEGACRHRLSVNGLACSLEIWRKMEPERFKPSADICGAEINVPDTSAFGKFCAHPPHHAADMHEIEGDTWNCCVGFPSQAYMTAERCASLIKSTLAEIPSGADPLRDPRVRLLIEMRDAAQARGR